MDILLEASNAEQVIREIQIHWKTHIIIKTWTVASPNPNEKLELQIYTNELPYSRKQEKPTLASIRQQHEKQIEADGYVFFCGMRFISSIVANK